MKREVCGEEEQHIHLAKSTKQVVHKGVAHAAVADL